MTGSTENVRRRFSCHLFVLVMVNCLGGVRANLMTEWNEKFIRAIREETTPPCVAARNLAIFHIAIYDAVNSIEKKHRPFYGEVKFAGEASMEAAAAGAAHRVGTVLYPSREADFNAELARSLWQVENGLSKTNGLAVGRRAADQALRARANDGSTTTVPYVPSNTSGQWRRTHPLRGPELSQWRFVKFFALTNIGDFQLPPPPGLESTTYAKDLDEVRRLGAKQSSARNSEQTEIARFWSDFSYTETPPGHWNQIARAVASQKRLSLAENARLFALLNVALADASIVAWDGKFRYNTWRPVTAIQQADKDGNDATESDTAWESLLTNPSFPEYPSGHSTFSGAAAEVLSDFFGTDRVEFSVGSDSMTGIRRHFTSFSGAAAEIGKSRIYGGIHFGFSDETGRAAGKRIGAFVSAHCLKPKGQK